MRLPWHRGDRITSGLDETNVQHLHLSKFRSGTLTAELHKFLGALEQAAGDAKIIIRMSPRQLIETSFAIEWDLGTALWGIAERANGFKYLDIRFQTMEERPCR